MKKRHKEGIENRSPWLHQIKEIRRPRDSLNSNDKGDVSIIGGGIAGICTAYYLLRDTRNKVILIEGNKVAHGATGHNAGQIVSYFEKPFSEIVKEYGLEMAGHGQEEILSAWNLLEEIYKEITLQTPLSTFIGYAGCTTFEQLVHHLENKLLRAKAKIRIDEVFVSEKSPFVGKIPSKYSGLYTIVPKEKIMELLEIKNNNYHVALASKKGCLNSALFCEEILGYILEKYKDRFKLFEFTPVEKIELDKNTATLYTKQGLKVKSGKVVLCTNGFESLHIINKEGKNIDTEFHDFVFGSVGFMTGYVDKTYKKPNAISYFGKNVKSEKDPYFYMTRREFEMTKKRDVLVCIGGPEMVFEDTTKYKGEKLFEKKYSDEIKSFIKKNLALKPDGEIEYEFHWHGLMGYTKTRLRAIGPHPDSSCLFYNLGCNGVGILPSIYGGYKIARFIAGIKMPESIFDVRV